MLLHPAIGVLMLLGATVYWQFMCSRVSAFGSALTLVELFYKPVMGTAPYDGAPYYFGHLHPITNNGASVELHSWETLVNYGNNFAPLGSLSVVIAEGPTGLWAPTRHRVRVECGYVPSSWQRLYGNSEAQFESMTEDIERHLLSSHPELRAEAPLGLKSHVRVTPKPGVPDHDFSLEWEARGPVLSERVLWWGYAENALVLLAIVWWAILVREVCRTKPWRALYRCEWQCWTCGYDMRNTADGEPCPECGAM